MCLSLIVPIDVTLHAQQAATAQPSAAQSKRASDYINEQLPHWLRLSGEYRARFESLGGIAFKTGNSDAYVLGRARLNTTIIPTSWPKLQFQGQDSQIGGRNPVKPDAPPYEDTFDVRQAYVELGNVESSKFGLRAGRQELFFGEMRLLGHLNWTNTARSFDGVRASYRTKNYRIDAFSASVVNPKDGSFNRRTDGNNLHGVYSSFAKVVPKATLEPYLFWRVSRGVKSEAGTLGKLDFKTIGLRWVGKLPKNFDYGAEVAGQTGKFGTDDVRAMAGHWILGYSMPKIKTMPRVFAEYNYASGDRNPTDGRRGTFDQLYPTGHDKLGLADQVGWRNVEHGRAGLELKPSKKLAMSGSYHLWWLANAHDGLYNAAGTLVARVTNGSAGRYVGQEADVQSTYPLTSQMQLGAGYAHIFHRKHMADVVSLPTYINCPPEIILGRMLGKYDYGDGRQEQDPNYMIFSQRDCNFPQKTFGLWWLSQFRRWGMVKSAPDYTGIVNKVIRQDIYLDAMKDMGVTTKVKDMQKQTLFDGVFDPADPEKYAMSFAVHSRV